MVEVEFVRAGDGKVELEAGVGNVRVSGSDDGVTLLFMQRQKLLGCWMWGLNEVGPPEQTRRSAIASLDPC